MDCETAFGHCPELLGVPCCFCRKVWPSEKDPGEDPFARLPAWRVAEITFGERPWNSQELGPYVTTFAAGQVVR
jgi:hypothetical protein